MRCDAFFSSFIACTQEAFHGAEDIAGALFPLMRIFQVNTTADGWDAPQRVRAHRLRPLLLSIAHRLQVQDVGSLYPGGWQPVVPGERIAEFSAVCYLSSRPLFERIFAGKVSHLSPQQHDVQELLRGTGCNRPGWFVLGRHTHSLVDGRRLAGNVPVCVRPQRNECWAAY